MEIKRRFVRLDSIGIRRRRRNCVSADAWLGSLAVAAIRAARSGPAIVIDYIEKNTIYKQLKRQTTSTIDASCVVPAPFT